MKNEIGLNADSFPKTTSVTNHYKLFEFNGDKLAVMWEKVNTKAKYGIYATAITFTALAVIGKLLRILAFVGLIKNHDQNLFQIDPANNSVKLAKGGTVTVSGGQVTGEGQ